MQTCYFCKKKVYMYGLDYEMRARRDFNTQRILDTITVCRDCAKDCSDPFSEKDKISKIIDTMNKVLDESLSK